MRALACVTDRTVAALNQGTPKIDEMPPMVTRRSRSKWKPDPFIIFRSGLLTIRLRVTERASERERVTLELTLGLELLCCQRHSRGDLGLQEDQDEHQQSRNAAGRHHPDWEGLLFTHGVDEPASDFGVSHLNSFWHNQFLKRVEKVSENCL